MPNENAALDSITELMEKRAQQNILQRFRALTDLMKRDDLLMDELRHFTVAYKTTKGREVTETLCSIFWRENSDFLDVIRDKILPEEIKKETRKFVENVDRLLGDVQQLRDNIPGGE